MKYKKYGRMINPKDQGVYSVYVDDAGRHFYFTAGERVYIDNLTAWKWEPRSEAQKEAQDRYRENTEAAGLVRVTVLIPESERARLLKYAKGLRK